MCLGELRRTMWAGVMNVGILRPCLSETTNSIYTFSLVLKCFNPILLVLEIVLQYLEHTCANGVTIKSSPCLIENENKKEHVFQKIFIIDSKEFLHLILYTFSTAYVLKMAIFSVQVRDAFLFLKIKNIQHFMHFSRSMHKNDFKGYFRKYENGHSVPLLCRHFFFLAFHMKKPWLF